MVLGSLKLNGTPKIVASVNDAISLGHAEKVCSFDLVELRIDLFRSLDVHHILRVAAQFRSYPLLATIRSQAEGGGFRFSEEKRLWLFKKIIPHVDAVDIELSAKTILAPVVETAHQKKKKAIISYHDFDKTPSIPALNRILKRASAARADIVKIATMAKSRHELQQLARFTLMNADRNIVTITMGKVGILSRLFFPALGSLLTYASIGKPTAPGQINCAELSPLIKKFYSTR